MQKVEGSSPFIRFEFKPFLQSLDIELRMGVCSCVRALTVVVGLALGVVLRRRRPGRGALRARWVRRSRREPSTAYLLALAIGLVASFGLPRRRGGRLRPSRFSWPAALVATATTVATRAAGQEKRLGNSVRHSIRGRPNEATSPMARASRYAVLGSPSRSPNPSRSKSAATRTPTAQRAPSARPTTTVKARTASTPHSRFDVEQLQERLELEADEGTRTLDLLHGKPSRAPRLATTVND